MATSHTTDLPYVTSVPNTVDDPYEPKIFSSTRQIDLILKGKTLLNLSDYQLEPEEIEALVAGLGFIPTEEPDLATEIETHVKAVERYTRAIDIALSFPCENSPKDASNSSDNSTGTSIMPKTGTDPSPDTNAKIPLVSVPLIKPAIGSKKKQEEKSGHLYRWIESKWSPPKHDWQNQEIPKQLLDRLRQPTLFPGSTDDAMNHDDQGPMETETGFTAEITKDLGSSGSLDPEKPPTCNYGNPTTKPAPILGAIVRSHPAILAALDKLAKNKDIHILSADKGGAIVIWKTSDYDREAERQLSDTDCYEKLTKEEYDKQLNETHVAISDAAESLYRTGRIKRSELEAIKEAIPRGSAIYFLCKIHKKRLVLTGSFPGRPIVRTFEAVVHLLDKLLTEWTSTLLPLIDGSLIDTTDLINKLPKGPLPASATITTADVNSLYPCIPLDQGIAASVEFFSLHYERLKVEFEDRNLLPPPSPQQFERALTLVMHNSFITFKNRTFFRQRKGTAMGICISVYFANCYMWKVSQRVLTRQIPLPGVLTFLRFIDDILVIQADGNREVLKLLFDSITNEDCTYVIDKPGRRQSFLDVFIYFAENGHLETEPFTKPTSTTSFLQYLSNHPDHCRDSIPYAQLIRLRRITTNYDKFIVAAMKLIRAFKLRDYPEDLLMKQLVKVSKMKREDLLVRKSARNSTRPGLKPNTEMARRPTKNEPPKSKHGKKRAKREARESVSRTLVTPATPVIQEGPTFRLITPFTRTIDNKSILNTLRSLDAERKKLHPAEHSHHKLMDSARSALVHSKRATIQSKFTRIIKNPKVPNKGKT